MKPNRYIQLFCVLLLLMPGCGGEQKKSAIIIGISSDPESLNPLYAFSGYEVSISEILYPSLVQHDWDYSLGDMVTTPLLAEKWEWGKDSSSIKIFLRKNLKWSDGRDLTIEDVIYSFVLFSDPDVQSRLYGTFKNFRTEDNLRIKKESFVAEDSRTLKIIFREGAVPSIIDLDLPVLPYHIYKNIPIKELAVKEKSIKMVTCSPFVIKKWDKGQSVILSCSRESFLVNDKTPDELIFKIIPDYNSRLTQLKNGEVDMIEDIRIDDAGDLEKNEKLTLALIKGREYDYLGWNNIDPEAYSRQKRIAPHKLFGSVNVRKALTLGINRDEILKEYLLDYAQAASTPVSPIFTGLIDTGIAPYRYDPSSAKELLKSEKWMDADNDGILEKGDAEFSFVLNYPSGNPRRDFAAVIIRNNLKMLGIDVRPEPLELSVFFERLFRRELNAWMAGWSIPIPPDMKLYWYSELEQSPFNVGGYRNKNADMLIERLEQEKNASVKKALYAELQKIFYADNPVTFLYWIDNIVAYNRKIKNITITPLGAVHHVWEWQLDE